MVTAAGGSPRAWATPAIVAAIDAWSVASETSWLQSAWQPPDESWMCWYTRYPPTTSRSTTTVAATVARRGRERLFGTASDRTGPGLPDRLRRHERVPNGRVAHGRVPHGRVPHGRVPHGRVPNSI